MSDYSANARSSTCKPTPYEFRDQGLTFSRRLKVPPAIAQFQNVLDRNQASQAFKLLNKYRPETKAEKKERLQKEATAISEGKKREDASKKPYTVKYGLNHVVGLIENKKATLVLIPNDVDPIELVVYLPALCRKMGVPYAVSSSKSSNLPTLLTHVRSSRARLVSAQSSTRRPLLFSLSLRFAPRTSPISPSSSPPSRRDTQTNTKRPGGTGVAVSWAQKPMPARRRSARLWRAPSRSKCSQMRWLRVWGVCFYRPASGNEIIDYYIVTL
jgi:ribosomal protein L7Ae-like RNA K-turn-binding protein